MRVCLPQRCFQVRLGPPRLFRGAAQPADARFEKLCYCCRLQFYRFKDLGLVECFALLAANGSARLNFSKVHTTNTQTKTSNNKKSDEITMFVIPNLG